MKKTVAAAVILLVLILAVASPAVAQDKIGEEVELKLSTPHPYSNKGGDQMVWIDIIQHPSASYIKVHFSQFDLGPGDYVLVKSQDGKQSYKFKEKGDWKGNTGSFYATHIKGDTAIIELYSNGEKCGYGYDIDSYGYGYPAGSSITEAIPSPEAVCGATDWDNAKCYSGTMYDKARAVARLHIGSTSACTGWLFGTAGHLVTNEHCLTSQANVNSTDFEFMGETATCNDASCDTWMGCPGTIWTGAGTYVTDNAGLDYCLVLLAGNPQNTYGYLQARATPATVGETVYIPQHPQAYAKKIADKNSGSNCQIDSATAAPCSGGGSGDYGYTCDTAGGSSGSPVISQQSHLVLALHHCASATGGCPNRGLKILEVTDDMGSNLPPGAIPGGCSAPSSPSGLSVTDNCAPADLSWSTVSGADGYNVYRYTGTCTGATWTKIGTTTGTTFSDPGVTAGTTYAWIVRAYAGTDTCESGNSNCVSTTVLSTPATPAAPMASDDCAGILLSWPSVSGATSYIVQRGTKSNCSGQGQIGTSATTGYTDATAAIGTTYYYTVIAVNGCGSGSASSCSAAAVHNLVAPTVNVTPDGTTSVCVGTNIVFTCAVTGGSGTYTYQWTRDGANIAGATSSNYTATFATAQSHLYNCRVADPSGCTGTFTDASNSTGTWSASHTVNVTPDGTTTRCVGVNMVFTAAIAGGTGPFTYQWTEDGANITNATNSTYTANKATAQSHLYNCQVTDTAGCPGSVGDATNSTGTWTGPSHTVSVTPDGTTTACLGANIVFTAAASGGTGPYTYQWTRDGGNIAGATTSTHTANYGTAQSHNYNCLVADAGGCAGQVSDAANSVGTWQACIPNIVYQSNLSLTAVNEDGDGIVEAGEKWQISVTVTNNGIAAANSVLGSLAGEGIEVCNNPGTFGNIAIGGTGTYIFQFIPLTSQWYGTYACGDSIGFDLTTKSSDSGAYTYGNDLNFYTAAVGSPAGNESATAADQTVKNTTKDATFAPAFVASACNAATVSYTLGGTTDLINCVVIVLVAPDAATTTLKAAGATDANPYTVTTFFNAHGAGTYILRITEVDACGTAAQNCTVTGISMQIANSGGGGPGCTSWTAACSACSMTVDVTPSGATTVCTGTNIFFTATQSGGTSPFTYQWTENGADISGATSSAYAASKASTGTFTYNCRVSDSAGCIDKIDATAPTGTWVAPPTGVTVTPSGTTSVCTGANIVFTAAVAGGATPVYQWTENGANISGATNSSYTASKAAGGSFMYTCIVYNAGCATTVTDATPSTGAWASTPTVDVTPNGTTSVTVGNPITFTAAASGGTAPYTYQWTRDGSDISGATNSTLTESYGTVQSHGYNCKVVSSGCATAAQDATASTGDWQAGAVPGEVPSQSWTDKQTQIWDTVATATGYRLHRGQLAGLPDLLTTGSDSCTRYDGAATSLGTLTEDPALLPPGDFFWYIAIAYNGSGDGSGGTATAGLRVVNSSGICP